MQLEDGRSWKRHVDQICRNIRTEPVVRDSEESNQPLRSPELMFKVHSTSVAQLPASYRDSRLSTTSTSLGDDHPRTNMRIRLQKRKEDERRNNAEGKAKRLCTSMELDIKGKQHSTKLLAKEIAAKASPEDTDTDDSVVVDDDVTMSESQVTLPPSDRNFC